MPTSKNLVGMGHTSHWRQDNPGQSSQSLVRCLGQPPLWQLTRTEQFHMRKHLIFHHTTDPWGTLVTSSKEIPLWVAGIHHYNKHHKINYSLSNCMQHSPSYRVNNSSVRQEINHFSWNSNVHYCVHMIPPLDPSQSQLNPADNLMLCCFKIQYNNTVPCMPRSLKLNFTCISHLPHAHYIPCPFHVYFFMSINNV